MTFFQVWKTSILGARLRQLPAPCALVKPPATKKNQLPPSLGQRWLLLTPQPGTRDNCKKQSPKPLRPVETIPQRIISLSSRDERSPASDIGQNQAYCQRSQTGNWEWNLKNNLRSSVTSSAQDYIQIWSSSQSPPRSWPRGSWVCCGERKWRRQGRESLQNTMCLVEQRLASAGRLSVNQLKWDYRGFAGCSICKALKGLSVIATAKGGWAYGPSLKPRRKLFCTKKNQQLHLWIIFTLYCIIV